MQAAVAESPVTFSPLATLKYLVTGGAMAAAGYYLWPAQMVLLKFIGGGLLVTGVLAVPVLLVMGVGVAACPLCGARVEVMPGGGEFIECPRCPAYLAAAQRRLRQMDADFVAAEPKFKVKLPWWPDLRIPSTGSITIGGPSDYVQDQVQELLLTRRIPERTVEAVWPDLCCVCRAPATRYESLAREVRAYGAKNPAVVERKLVVRVNGVPHCAEHEHGVALAGNPGAAGRVLLFRSHAYRNAFMRANPWKVQWEWG